MKIVLKEKGRRRAGKSALWFRGRSHPASAPKDLDTQSNIDRRTVEIHFYKRVPKTGSRAKLLTFSKTNFGTQPKQQFSRCEFAKVDSISVTVSILEEKNCVKEKFLNVQLDCVDETAINR